METPEDNPTGNETNIDDVRGVVHTGSGDVIVLGWSLMYHDIKKKIPKEHTQAIEEILNALREIGNRQKVVKELKTVHNMFHNLETILSTLQHPISRDIEQSNYKGAFKMIGYTWRLEVMRHIRRIEDFAQKEMTSLEPKFDSSIKEVLKGPSWVISLVAWRKDFEANMDDGNHESVCDSWIDLIGICRDELVRIDKELLRAAEQLDKLTERILRTINDESSEH